MKLGVIFPQIEIGSDPVAIRDYAQAAEQLGYAHILAFDHVLGADPSQQSAEWMKSSNTGRAKITPMRFPYTHKSMFHEPFILFGYLAGITHRIELVTGVIIIAQRQTALVAKQAAEVDLLSGGRLRLGIGTGWNTVEYEALGQDFHTRGKRSEEQISLLRRLWTEEVVNFKGKWDNVSGAGINPLPVQRPIPIWLGGRDDRVLRRIAKLGDGWFPQWEPDDAGRKNLEQLYQYVREANRDPSEIGVEGRVSIANSGPEKWASLVEAWQRLGVSHLAVNTMGAGFTSPDQHINAIRQFKEVVSPN